MNLYENGEFKNLAYDESQKIYQLPFSFQLVDFSIEMYNPKIALVDANTGVIKHEKGKNLEIIDEGAVVELSSWTIKIDTLLKLAVPAGKNHYWPLDTLGTTAAAYVTATSKENKTVSGWIAAGSFRFPSKYMVLDEDNIVALTKPEPRKFSSNVNIKVSDKIANHVIEVNLPHKIHGWKVYQMGYDTRMGQWSDLSVLEVVRDPWLPFVYTGFIMLIAGAMYLFWIGKDIGQDKKEEN